MRPAPLSTDRARTLRCCSQTALSSDSISASSGVGLPSFAARISKSISAAASAPSSRSAIATSLSSAPLTVESPLNPGGFTPTAVLCPCPGREDAGRRPCGRRVDGALDASHPLLGGFAALAIPSLAMSRILSIVSCALAYIEFVGYVLLLARWEGPWGAGTFW